MKSEFLAIIDRFQGKRIVVVGDLILDRYISGKIERTSPEAPVPIVDIDSEYFKLGGACNVANNIKSLGAEPILIGIAGDDHEGNVLLDLLKQHGIDTDFIVRVSSRPTTIKTRVIAHDKHVVRYDRETKDFITTDIEEKILYNLRKVNDFSCVIFQDYQKGLLTNSICRQIIEEANKQGKKVLADPKYSFEQYSGVDVLKPNYREIEAMTEEKNINIKKACEFLSKRINPKAILVTKGKEGMYIYRKDSEIVHIDAATLEAVDITGAGDTVIAALSLALSADARLEDAAEISNHAAGIVVKKVGTETATVAELRKCLTG